MHMPHGSDWSAIREAGMNGDTRGAEPSDAASTDAEGYAQEGHATVVTRTQRNRLRRWSQKARDAGPVIGRMAGSHPLGIPAELTTLRSLSNWDQERRKLGRALRQQSGGGANRKAHREG